MEEKNSMLTPVLLSDEINEEPTIEEVNLDTDEPLPIGAGQPDDESICLTDKKLKELLFLEKKKNTTHLLDIVDYNYIRARQLKIYNLEETMLYYYCNYFGQRMHDINIPYNLSMIFNMCMSIDKKSSPKLKEYYNAKNSNRPLYKKFLKCVTSAKKLDPEYVDYLAVSKI